MRQVTPPSPILASITPYDPKYLPASVMCSANESPFNVGQNMMDKIVEAVRNTLLNRYPDPLANALRDDIAEVYGVSRSSVLVGNGGDELLFDIALAWGGVGRKMLNLPPTFSVYAANAHLTSTEIIAIARRDDFSIDEEAVLARVGEGDISYLVVTSPNNPTGQCASESFVRRLLDATDALVVVDEAYAEFSGNSVADLVTEHANLLVLRTFSKAYRLAGVRVGYVLGDPRLITELIKVRQPYSVDSLSQQIARIVLSYRDVVADSVRQTIAMRQQMIKRMQEMKGVIVYPSDANFILFKVENAPDVWNRLFDQGILIRDFSRSAGLEDCLRVTVGSAEENEAFLKTLQEIVAAR